MLDMPEHLLVREIVIHFESIGALTITTTLNDHELKNDLRNLNHNSF